MATSFSLGGTVDDYDAPTQASIKAVLAEGAGVSTSAVAITITAGSVVIDAEIFVESQAAADMATEDLAAGVFKDAASLQMALTERFEADNLSTENLVVREIMAAPTAVVPDKSSFPIAAIVVPAMAAVLLATAIVLRQSRLKIVSAKV